MKQSEGHVEFIAGYEYYRIDDQLFRAELAKPIVDGKRHGEFVTLGSGIELAMRLARIAAGQRES